MFEFVWTEEDTRRHEARCAGHRAGCEYAVGGAKMDDVRNIAQIYDSKRNDPARASKVTAYLREHAPELLQAGVLPKPMAPYWREFMEGFADGVELTWRDERRKLQTTLLRIQLNISCFQDELTLNLKKARAAGERYGAYWAADDQDHTLWRAVEGLKSLVGNTDLWTDEVIRALDNAGVAWYEEYIHADDYELYEFLVGFAEVLGRSHDGMRRPQPSAAPGATVSAQA